jgi:hypothetical protein
MVRVINLVARGFGGTAQVACSSRSLMSVRGHVVDNRWNISVQTARDLVTLLTTGVRHGEVVWILFWGFELQGLVPPPSAWPAIGGLSPLEAALSELVPLFTDPARAGAMVSFLGCTYAGVDLASDPRAPNLKTYLEWLWRARQVEVFVDPVPNACAGPSRPQRARRPPPGRRP